MQNNQCYWITTDALLHVWYFMLMYQEESKSINVIAYLLYYNKMYFIWDFKKKGVLNVQDL